MWTFVEFRERLYPPSVFSPEKRAKAMIKAVKKLTPQQIDNLAGLDFLNLDDYSPELVKEKMIKVIEDFTALICKSGADRGILFVDQLNGYIFSAGTSWGDDPSDDFSIIHMFGELPENIKEEGKFCHAHSVDTFLKNYEEYIPQKMQQQIRALKMIEKL